MKTSAHLLVRPLLWTRSSERFQMQLELRLNSLQTRISSSSDQLPKSITRSERTIPSVHPRNHGRRKVLKETIMEITCSSSSTCSASATTTPTKTEDWPSPFSPIRPLFSSSDPSDRPNHYLSYLLYRLNMKYPILLCLLLILTSCDELNETIQCINEYVATFKDKMVTQVPFRTLHSSRYWSMHSPTPWVQLFSTTTSLGEVRWRIS